jgi:hypothetical protein
MCEKGYDLRDSVCRIIQDRELGAMFDKETRMAYPISWITKSPVLMDYLRSSEFPESDLLIADFASGEHDRVPSFFLRILRRAIEPKPKRRWVVYSVDVHALRLDSLLGALEEERLLGDARVVLAGLERMRTKATMRPGELPFLLEHDSAQTWLDGILMSKEYIPAESFEIGVLNNDVIGYLHEYYKEYGQAAAAIEGIYEVMKDGGLLIATMPCELYPLDNVAALVEVGFSYVNGFDIDTSSGRTEVFQEKPAIGDLSRLGHYSFLVFLK